MKKYKSKIVGILLISFGVAIGHGFPTLYQYIETLGGDYTSEPQRTEILNADIQTGEPMKASVMNAKFNSLNHELIDLGTRITSLEGMSSGGTVSSDSKSCSGKGCFFIINGVADGEGSPRDFLAYTAGASVSIVYKYAVDGSGLTPVRYYTTGFETDTYGTGSTYSTGVVPSAVRIESSETNLLDN